MHLLWTVFLCLGCRTLPVRCPSEHRKDRHIVNRLTNARQCYVFDGYWERSLRTQQGKPYASAYDSANVSQFCSSNTIHFQGWAGNPKVLCRHIDYIIDVLLTYITIANELSVSLCPRQVPVRQGRKYKPT